MLEPKNLGKKVIAVELSGSPKLYHYVASEVGLLNRVVGDRVVIPNKLKEDGSLSLSIGVFKGVAQDVPEEGLKPVVAFIDTMAVRTVQLWMLADAQKANAEVKA
jgi:hypothetical protein